MISATKEITKKSDDFTEQVYDAATSIIPSWLSLDGFPREFWGWYLYRRRKELMYIDFPWYAILPPRK